LQPAATVIDSLAAPPEAVAPGFIGDTPKVHVGAAAACVTVTVWPATVIVPVRLDVAVFAATE
jgi:hypothetical protein